MNYTHPPYFQPPHSGPRCSTARSARLRQRRFDMRYLEREEPAEYTALAEAARDMLLATEADDLALARARAMAYLVEHCPLTLEKDAFLVGGEEPFLFNAMLPALNADAYQRSRAELPVDGVMREMLEQSIFTWPCFEGHITPGLEYLLAQGTDGLRRRLLEHCARWKAIHPEDTTRQRWYEAALLSCDNLERYADRLRQQALRLAEDTGDPDWSTELRAAAAVLVRVPRQPAETLQEALQSYWLAYILVTIEMGGCTPGGGLGLGRPDQYLYPYYRRDIDSGRLTRDQALELIEGWLLNFQHCDYHTWHSLYTVGSQASLGGVTDPEDALGEYSVSVRVYTATHQSQVLFAATPVRVVAQATTFTITSPRDQTKAPVPLVVTGRATPGVQVRVTVVYSGQALFVKVKGEQLYRAILTADTRGVWETPPIDTDALLVKIDTYTIIADRSVFPSIMLAAD